MFYKLHLILPLVFIYLLQLSGLTAQYIEYYDKLGVDPGATTKEIRKAFKKLAVSLHPDKSDDPNAVEKFREISEIYEVLKDDEQRKTYDRHGEEGLKDKKERQQQRGGRRSWQFYQNEGLYDDDDEIVTFDSSDFDVVLRGMDVWFVNFYSTMCSHCHDLAPAWRELAKQLHGIVNIGAVNCMDQRHLCNQQRLTGYPSVILFQHGKSGVKFNRGDRTLEKMLNFVMERSNSDILKVRSESYLRAAFAETNRYRGAVFNVCSQDGDCIADIQERKLAIAYLGDTKFYSVDCEKENIDCEAIFGFPSGVYAQRRDKIVKIDTREVLDPIEIKKILDPVVLPPFTDLKNDEAIFDEPKEGVVKVIVATRKTKPAHFEKNPTLLELRKSFRFFDKNLRHRLVHYNCDDAKYANDCGLFMSTSKWISIIVVYRGKWQQYLGSDFRAADLALFAKSVVESPNLSQVTHLNFDQQILSGGHWFVDFYSPSCSPCKSFMKVMRSASKQYSAGPAEKQVKFVSIDCSLAVNLKICNRYNIRSWPSARMFLDGKSDTPLDYDQHHNEPGVHEFIRESFNPSMVTLSPDSYKDLVQKRAIGVAWMVKFGTRTCGPCRQIEQQMKILARELADGDAGEVLKIGVVDCNDHYNFCSDRHFIESYPTVRVYPAKWTTGAFNSYEEFDLRRQHRNHLNLGVFLADNGLGSMPALTVEPYDLKQYIRPPKPNTIAIVDFYANWCQPCLEFKPRFAALALTWRQSKYYQAYKNRGWEVKFLAIDCARSHSSNQACSQVHIPHYPYVQSFSPRGKGIALDNSWTVQTMMEKVLGSLASAGAGHHRNVLSQLEKDEL